MFIAICTAIGVIFLAATFVSDMKGPKKRK